MTVGSAQYTERLTRNNALLLLVDHQVGLYTGVREIDILQLKHNVVALTRAMFALKVPVVVTTTTEKWWGPLIPELADVLHGVPVIERTTLNAWDEKRVVDAELWLNQMNRSSSTYRNAFATPLARPLRMVPE